MNADQSAIERGPITQASTLSFGLSISTPDKS